MYRWESAALASPFGDVNGGGRGAARWPRHKNAHSLPKPPNTYRIRSAADVAARPVTPAEVAQARYFEAILQAEIVQFQNLSKLRAPRWMGGSTGEHRPPAGRTEPDGRIEEVDRLLKALRDRFPHGALGGGPRSDD